MNVRLARLASAALIGAVLLLPGSAFAADPAPAGPLPVVTDWQAHLDHMRTMDGPLETHVAACVEVHGPMAGMLGANGSMVGMMDGGMVR
jgi:hypothetical protein